jgi:hypothetical protein
MHRLSTSLNAEQFFGTGSVHTPVDSFIMLGSMTDKLHVLVMHKFSGSVQLASTLQHAPSSATAEHTP